MTAGGERPTAARRRSANGTARGRTPAWAWARVSSQGLATPPFPPPLPVTRSGPAGRGEAAAVKTAARLPAVEGGPGDGRGPRAALAGLLPPPRKRCKSEMRTHAAGVGCATVTGPEEASLIGRRRVLVGGTAVVVVVVVAIVIATVIAVVITGVTGSVRVADCREAGASCGREIGRTRPGTVAGEREAMRFGCCLCCLALFSDATYVRLRRWKPFAC